MSPQFFHIKKKTSGLGPHLTINKTVISGGLETTVRGDAITILKISQRLFITIGGKVSNIQSTRPVCTPSWLHYFPSSFVS